MQTFKKDHDIMVVRWRYKAIMSIEVVGDTVEGVEPIKDIVLNIFEQHFQSKLVSCRCINNLNFKLVNKVAVAS